MSTIETGRNADDGEQYDVKVPGKLNDAKAGEKIAAALRKWAKRIDGSPRD